MSKLSRYRKSIPDCNGWWLWKQSINDTPERLLIAGNKNHAEVATDCALAHVTGREYDHESDHESEEGLSGNWWEMTACKTMGGYWMLDEKVEFQN